MKKKLLFALPLALLLAATAGYFALNHRIAGVLDQRLADLVASGDYRELRYDAVTLSLDGSIALDNLYVADAQGNSFVLEDVRLSDFDYFSEVPHHLALAAVGVRFPAGVPVFGDRQDSALNTYLASMLDGDRLPVAVNYRYNYLPAEDSRLDTSLSVSLPDGFHLDSASVMRNVPTEAFTAGGMAAAGSPVPFQQVMRSADIPSAFLSLQDLGMVGDMMVIQGRMNNITAEEYRQQLLAQLQVVVMFSPRQLQALAQQMLDRVAEFLEGEKTLRIAITPANGGNFQQLQADVMGSFYIGDYQQIADLLNLEIETL